MSAIAGLLTVLVGGCSEGNLTARDAPEAAEQQSSEDAAPVPVTRSVANGAITLQGPDGYCLDEAVKSDTSNTAFALFEPCDAPEDGAEIADRLTVTVDLVPEGDWDISTGNLLSGIGLSTAAEERRRGGVSMVRVDDTITPKWRGAMELKGHLILLGAHGRHAEPSDLRAFAEAIRTASGAQRSVLNALLR